MKLLFQPSSDAPAVDIAAGLAHSLVAFDSPGFAPDVYYAGRDARYNAPPGQIRFAAFWCTFLSIDHLRSGNRQASQLRVVCFSDLGQTEKEAEQTSALTRLSTVRKVPQK